MVSSCFVTRVLSFVFCMLVWFVQFGLLWDVYFFYFFLFWVGLDRVGWIGGREFMNCFLQNVIKKKGKSECVGDGTVQYSRSRCISGTWIISYSTLAIYEK
ncbi:hypothetical protein L873DRAFT_1115434 [Choiromyces venosus 120613-1]|uniref:Uncharacterized protein n=1 Tax=Choiromyces venosus 120613-1 TaxID=1336337 RepID=A0A3N4JLH4_9PEZI|nr:hypothetical protein L873DRAFT_1115434 [Choiromyces venosus 120613-1]